MSNMRVIDDPGVVRSLVALFDPPPSEPDWDRLLANAPRTKCHTPEFKADCSRRSLEQWRRRRERMCGLVGEPA